MVLRCGGVPQNPLVSDRIQGFCDAVCTPESKLFCVFHVTEKAGRVCHGDLSAKPHDVALAVALQDV